MLDIKKKMNAHFGTRNDALSTDALTVTYSAYWAKEIRQLYAYWQTYTPPPQKNPETLQEVSLWKANNHFWPTLRMMMMTTPTPVWNYCN